MRLVKICSSIVVIALVAVLFAGLSTPVAAMTWTGGPLDSSNVFSSVAVDSTGSPKICYHVRGDGGLKYIEWIHGTSTTPGHWSAPVWIDQSPNVGYYCDIALYPNGDPAVSYYDGNLGTLKFAWRNPQGVWGPGTIDDGNGGAHDVGYYNSIAIGTDGREQICYWDATNRNLKFAEWIFGEPDGHWGIKTIASGDVQGRCSLALDKDNNPYISYTGDRAGGGSDVRLAYRTGSTSWQTQYVSGSSSSVAGISIAVDPTSAKVGVVYQTSTMNYVERNPATGTWSTPTAVDTTNSQGSSSSMLAFDKSKQPAFSYAAQGVSGYKVLKFAYRDAAGWHKLTADDGGRTLAWVGDGSSLAIGGDNMPSISYWTGEGGRLKYIEGHATSTALTCTVTPSSVALNQAFTVKGKLTSSGAALAKEAVHLERRKYSSGAWGAWANVAGTTRITASDGTVATSQKLATLGTYQYRWHYVGSIAYLAKYSLPVTVTVHKIPTKTTITASDTTPAVGQSVTFTVTLKAGTTGLSKPVHLWCTFNGVRYERGTFNTVNGVYKFTGPFSRAGLVIYHADFKGDSTYAASSGTVTVSVQ